MPLWLSCFWLLFQLLRPWLTKKLPLPGVWFSARMRVTMQVKDLNIVLLKIEIGYAYLTVRPPQFIHSYRSEPWVFSTATSVSSDGVNVRECFALMDGWSMKERYEIIWMTWPAINSASTDSISTSKTQYNVTVNTVIARSELSESQLTQSCITFLKSSQESLLLTWILHSYHGIQWYGKASVVSAFVAFIQRLDDNLWNRVKMSCFRLCDKLITLLYLPPQKSGGAQKCRWQWRNFLARPCAVARVSFESPCRTTWPLSTYELVCKSKSGKSGHVLTK